MKKIIGLLLVSFFIPVSSFCQSPNLIINPNAEEGPMLKGWNVISGNWTQVMQNQGGFPAAPEGIHYFYSGNTAVAGTRLEMYQDVNVADKSEYIDKGWQDFKFLGLVLSYNQAPIDTSQITLYLLDAGKNILDEFDLGKNYNYTSWKKIAYNFTAQKNTRFVRIKLTSIVGTPVSNDGYFDSLSLVADEVIIPPVQDTLPEIYEFVSANNDGMNDFFKIKNLSYYSQHRVTILNQWGQVVFHTENYANDWNAAELPGGSYYYVVWLGNKEYKGPLEIVR